MSERPCQTDAARQEREREKGERERSQTLQQRLRVLLLLQHLAGVPVVLAVHFVLQRPHLEGQLAILYSKQATKGSRRVGGSLHAQGAGTKRKGEGEEGRKQQPGKQHQKQTNIHGVRGDGWCRSAAEAQLLDEVLLLSQVHLVGLDVLQVAAIWVPPPKKKNT